MRQLKAGRRWKNAFLKFAMKTPKLHIQLIFTCSKSTKETLEKGVKLYFDQVTVAISWVQRCYSNFFIFD